jgi:hypothetical protein
MASAGTKYQEAKAKMAEARKQIEKIASDAFKELTAEFFEGQPDIVSFGWTQYTPYWNDGESCTFSANTEYPIVTFKAKDGKVIRYDENCGTLNEVNTAVTDGDIEFSEDDEIEMEPYDDELSKHAKAVSKFLSVFDEDDLETMFGDHARVTVTRKGTSTDEYEHE